MRKAEAQVVRLNAGTTSRRRRYVNYSGAVQMGTENWNLFSMAPSTEQDGSWKISENINL